MGVNASTMILEIVVLILTLFGSLKEAPDLVTPDPEGSSDCFTTDFCSCVAVKIKDDPKDQLVFVYQCLGKHYEIDQEDCRNVCFENFTYKCFMDCKECYPGFFPT